MSFSSEKVKSTYYILQCGSICGHNRLVTWLYWRTLLKTDVLVPNRPTPSVSRIILLLLFITPSVRWVVLRAWMAAPKLSVIPWKMKKRGYLFLNPRFAFQKHNSWKKKTLLLVAKMLQRCPHFKTEKYWNPIWRDGYFSSKWTKVWKNSIPCVALLEHNNVRVLK